MCADPKGQKYDHGIKWGLPIVSKDWIMSCLEDKRLVSEKPFLIGESNVFDENKPMPLARKEAEKEEENHDSRVQETTLHHEDQESVS